MLAPLPLENWAGSSPHVVLGLVAFLKRKPTEESRWRSLRIGLLESWRKTAVWALLALAFSESVSPFVKQESRLDEPVKRRLLWGCLGMCSSLGEHLILSSPLQDPGLTSRT